MTDEHKRLSPPRSTYLPAPQESNPNVALPSLPTSSGKVWGSRTTIMQADAAYVRAHTELVEAITARANQVRQMVDANIGLALKLAELQILPELMRHRYELGRRDRAHETAMQELTHQTAETNARFDLVRAQQHLASLQPDSQPVHPPPSSPTQPSIKGLSTAEVEMVAQRLPEMKRETLETLLMMLSGLLAEKNK